MKVKYTALRNFRNAKLKDGIAFKGQIVEFEESTAAQLLVHKYIKAIDGKTK